MTGRDSAPLTDAELAKLRSDALLAGLEGLDRDGRNHLIGYWAAVLAGSADTYARALDGIGSARKHCAAPVQVDRRSVRLSVAVRRAGWSGRC